MPRAPVLLLLALAACAAPRDERSAASVLRVVDEVEELVALRFHDPGALGAEWREALSRARAALARDPSEARLSAEVNAALATLGTSHTELRTRAEPRAWELADVFWEALPRGARERAFGPEPVLAGIGVLTDEVDGLSVVTAVLDGSPAARAGLARGDRIRSCDGEPFRPVESFAGRAGVPTRLTVARGEREATLLVVPDAARPRERYLAAMRASARVLPHGGRRLAVVHAWSMAGAEFQEALRELLLDGPLAGADGLVLDLRDGLGGASPDAITLFARDVPTLEWRGRDGAVTALPGAWRKPVVLLVDERTTSGKEVLAHAFRRARRGPIVGTRTAGAVVGGSLFLLSDGSVLYLAVRDVRVDGVRLEGRGVEPDVLVTPGGPGSDAMLERALEALAAELE